ncbi:type II secretion system protein [Candidatus Uhrbacteria bacterium]|jgi:prepilin-type N-terminal cleavage/methylation domain-containing protein|nr:type II secretion system protein [Candidatus Uhrbacteria bacterium]MBT7717367.1 type II secretion system protein [Candidatus Uhrbacteria bacterium]
MKKPGFTFLEILVVVGIMLILLTIVFSSIRMTNASLQSKTHQEVYSMLTEASRYARSGVAGSDWGVYFEYDGVTGAAVRATLFAGENYATRDTQYDRFTAFHDSIVFSDVTLVDIAPWSGNGDEITFESMSGDTHQTGSITLTTASKTTIVSVDSSGIPLIDYVQ